jgi:hypothetical protein
MKALMDNVEFTVSGNCGTVVKMVKYKTLSQASNEDEL